MVILYSSAVWPISFPEAAFLLVNTKETKRVAADGLKHARALGTRLRYGHYLTHAHSHIIRAKVALDSCFGLSWPYQHIRPISPPRHELIIRSSLISS